MHAGKVSSVLLVSADVPKAHYKPSQHACLFRGYLQGPITSVLSTEFYFCSAWAFVSVLVYLRGDYASVKTKTKTVDFSPILILLALCCYHWGI